MTGFRAALYYVFVFYGVTSLVIDLACRAFHADARLGPETRLRGSATPPWKVAALMLVNCASLAALVAAALAWGGMRRMAPASFADWLWVAAQAAVFLVLADSHFYWVHRLAHAQPWLFARFHSTHHRALHPNVWHCQYQHPLDYLATTALPALWIPLVLPLSHEAYVAALAIGHMTHIGGHCGYELTRLPLGLFSPSGLAARLDPGRRWLARHFNLVAHHDLHHQHPKRNFSLYFTAWDAIGGTELRPASASEGRRSPPRSGSSCSSAGTGAKS